MGVTDDWSERVEVWAVILAFKVVAVTAIYKWSQMKAKYAKSSYTVDESRLLSWKPHPLVEEEVVPDPVPTIGKLSESVQNMSATNFLSLYMEPKLHEEAIRALRKYGVGSCGPRGFYGTIDVHLELEERLAKFMGVEEACVYSYGFSTIASAIPAYAKKNDLLFVDEKVNFAIQKGLDASRSNVFYYRHNDMAHLEELLSSKAGNILKKRSFIIAEAIYFNTGQMCPLDKLVELRRKYKLRMILDESLSIGVLGEKGRGLTEYFNIPVSEVDLIVGSLEHSFGSIGGFCAGSHFIVEHQRLSGLGYCFSASLPPLLSKAAITSLDFIEAEPSRISTLCNNSKKLDSAFSKLQHYKLSGHPLSPVKHLYVKSDDMTSDQKESALRMIANHCMENGIAVAASAYLKEAEYNCPEPSLRITSNSALEDGQISKLSDLLEEAYTTTLSTH